MVTRQFLDSFDALDEGANDCFRVSYAILISIFAPYMPFPMTFLL